MFRAWFPAASAVQIGSHPSSCCMKTTNHTLNNVFPVFAVFLDYFNGTAQGSCSLCLRSCSCSSWMCQEGFGACFQGSYCVEGWQGLWKREGIEKNFCKAVSRSCGFSHMWWIVEVVFGWTAWAFSQQLSSSQHFGAGTKSQNHRITE